MTSDHGACHQRRQRGRVQPDPPRLRAASRLVAKLASRAPIRVFKLGLDRRLAKVAALENISRNTVTYRVQQAFDLCAHTTDTPTVKIRAALAVVAWLLNPPRGQ